MKRSELPYRKIMPETSEFMEDVLFVAQQLRDALAEDGDLLDVCLDSINNLEFIAYSMTALCVKLSPARRAELEKIPQNVDRLTVILPDPGTEGDA